MERSGETHPPPGTGISVIPVDDTTTNRCTIERLCIGGGIDPWNTKSGHNILGQSPYGRLPHPKNRRCNVFNSIAMVEGSICHLCHLRTKTQCKCIGKQDTTALLQNRLPTISNSANVSHWRPSHPIQRIDFDAGKKQSGTKGVSERMKARMPHYKKLPSTAPIPRIVPDSVLKLINVDGLTRTGSNRRALLGQPSGAPLDGSVPLGSAVRFVLQATLFGDNEGTRPVDIPSWLRGIQKQSISLQWTSDGRYILWTLSSYLILVDPFKGGLWSNSKPSNCEHGEVVGALKLLEPILYASVHPEYPHLVIAVGQCSASKGKPSSGSKRESGRPGSIYVYDIRSVVHGTGKPTRKHNTGILQPTTPAVPLVVKTLQKMAMPSNCILSPSEGRIVVSSGVFKEELLEAFTLHVEHPLSPAPTVSLEPCGKHYINDDFDEHSISFSPCSRFLLVPLKEKKSILVFPFPELNNDNGISSPFSQPPITIENGVSPVRKVCIGASYSSHKKKNSRKFYTSELGSVVTEWCSDSMSYLSSIRGLGPSSLYATAFHVNCENKLIAWAPELGTADAKEFETKNVSGDDRLAGKGEIEVPGGPRIMIGMTSPLRPLFAIRVEQPIKSIWFHPTRSNILMYSCSRPGEDGLTTGIISLQM